MQVVILCGGLGTRLCEETESRPEPRRPIADLPILSPKLKPKARFRRDGSLPCLGFEARDILPCFRSYAWNTRNVTLALGAKPQCKHHPQHPEDDLKETRSRTSQSVSMIMGGLLKRARLDGGENGLLLMSGDDLAGTEIAASSDCHRHQRNLLMLNSVRPTRRIGELVIVDGKSQDIKGEGSIVTAELL